MSLLWNFPPNLLTVRRTVLFVVAIGYAVVLAAVQAQWQMALVGGLTAMVLSFSDDDGALSGRLAMLAMVAAAAVAGGIVGHLVGVSALFWPLFLAAAFAAGWLYRAGRRRMLAARVFAISLSIIAGAPTMTAGELARLASVVAVCALARVIDHLLFGPLPRDAAGRSPGAPSITQTQSGSPSRSSMRSVRRSALRSALRSRRPGRSGSLSPRSSSCSPTTAAITGASSNASPAPSSACSPPSR